MPARADIEMVYQDLSLCDTIDVAGNLFLGREMTRAGFLDQATHAPRRTPHAGRAGDPHPEPIGQGGKASGGQRQSIAIARAASFEPQVLIMDEPTSALAVAEVEAVLALINRVKASGVSVVLITHRLQDLFRVCDRIAVMYEGTKVAERRSAGHRPGGSGPPHRRRGARIDDRLHRAPAGLARGGLPGRATPRCFPSPSSSPPASLFFSVTTDTFLTPGNILNLLRQAAPMLVVAVAMTFVITTGGIDLSVGSLVALVNALAAIALAAGVPWPLVVLGMLVLGGADRPRAGLVRRLPGASPPSSSRWRACRPCAASRST